MNTSILTRAVILVAVCVSPLFCCAETTNAPAEKVFVVQSIGHVAKTTEHTTIILDKKYQPGLLGLEGFSHIYVFWWFDKNDTPAKRSTLQVHPRGNPQNPLTGVFATRSPFRPNLLALTLCKIISIKENTVEVDALDAFSGTSVLDIKPFTPSDSVSGARVPDWSRR